MPIDLTPEEREALIALVIAAPGSTDVLYDALRCSLAVREANSAWGQRMIDALMRTGESRREIARRIGVPESTIRSWGARPGGDA